MKKVTLIPGDGIGPEITKVTMEAVSKVCPEICWEIEEAGISALEKHHTLVPRSVFDSLERNRIGLKGPITTPVGSGFRSINVMLRKKYDLYCNLRPIQSINHLHLRYPAVDLLIFRENTEDLYAGIEEAESPDCARSIKIITRRASLRIARSAFEYARRHQKQKVSVVTKANIMKLTDGLFLDCAREIASFYPEIALEEVLVDNMAMQLVLDPQQYGIILTENLYGDILSDLCAGLIGGLGLVSGANIGSDMALFEPAHGSAPQIAGKNLANPTAMLLSACMMLDHLDENEAAKRLRQGIHCLLADPDKRTADLGGKLGTKEFGYCLMKQLG